MRHGRSSQISQHLQFTRQQGRLPRDILYGQTTVEQHRRGSEAIRSLAGSPDAGRGRCVCCRALRIVQGRGRRNRSPLERRASVVPRRLTTQGAELCGQRFQALFALPGLSRGRLALAEEPDQREKDRHIDAELNQDKGLKHVSLSSRVWNRYDARSAVTSGHAEGKSPGGWPETSVGPAPRRASSIPAGRNDAKVEAKCAARSGVLTGRHARISITSAATKQIPFIATAAINIA